MLMAPGANLESDRALSQDVPAEASRPPPGRRLTVEPHAGFGAIAAVIVLVLDQASKLWLIYLYDLPNRGVAPIAPFVDFVMTWNRGVSYGLFQQDSELGRWLLTGFSVVVAIGLGAWMLRSQTRLTAVSLGLIIGGAAGNAIDRAAYGAVADFVFLHATVGTWELRWYVFNLADAAIVAGVIGLLYESVFPRRAAKAP